MRRIHQLYDVGTNTVTAALFLFTIATNSCVYRYASRCLMIEFSTPPVATTLGQYRELGKLWEVCSSCAGFCISLGNSFFSEGIEEVDNDILPRMTASASEDISPRVIPSYAILFWFALQVGNVTSKPHCAPCSVCVQHCPYPCTFSILNFNKSILCYVHPCRQSYV